VKFFYRRKSIPKFEEHGAAHLSFIGRGAIISLIWQLKHKKGETQVISLLKSKCKIDKLDVGIIGGETKHR
jgi:hypothetical protein